MPSSQAITHAIKRSGDLVPFNRERITNAMYRAAVAVGGRDRSIAERLTDQVVNILESRCPPACTPHVEEIQDVVEKVLIENGHARTAKAYILYREERTRHRQRRKSKAHRYTDNIPYHKLWEALVWALDHDVHTVERLNARIARGEFPDIVRESDALYEDDVDTAAMLIKDRLDEVRIAIIAGPSSSGKTTTTAKLAERLKEEIGINFVALNVDNYFFDLELHPKDEHGDYDFETPQALDLALINEHLVRLIAGEEVPIPFYNFKTGRREDKTTPMQVGPQDIILIDSLHGLYEDMTKDVPDEQKFRLYIEPLLQMKGPDDQFIRWTDIRLMRRMVRDARERAYDPEQTLLHWHYVRSSELRNIIPYNHTTDYIVNSMLAYELPIMRPILIDHFAEWVKKYKDAPLHKDAYQRAKRVYQLLKGVTPVEDDSPIPPTSHLREFIGGSAYTGHGH
jgi:uridine kinase